MNKKRNIKGSNLPTVNISREIISVLSRLNAEEVKEVINGIRDYVYKDKEPIVDEEITDIMDMVLDNINFIAKGYLNGKKGGRPKKSALQEVKETEFDLPKTDDNVENENKADLSPSKPSVDAEYHQQVEMPSNGLKTGKEEILEEDIINILNDNNIMSNPTNVRIDKETGKYYTDAKIKEIREKVEKSNNKPLPVVEDNIPLWEDYLKSISSKLRDIINDLNSNSRLRRTIQAPTNLKELLNNNVGRYYKDRVLRIIEHYTTQQTVA